MAIAGQLLTLAIVHWVLGFRFEAHWAIMAISASAALNLYLSIRYPRAKQLTDYEATVHLGFDLVQLALLLSLTGGWTNPFAFLLVVPVTISATVLSRKSTWILLALALVSCLILARWHLPLPWGAVPLQIPTTYLIGSWIGLVVSMVFLAIYAATVSADARRRSKALAATEAALEREHKLAELGTLAAAAAHELGTPLGTITLAARELLRETPKQDARYDDVALINDQVSRCRQILERLSHSDLGDAPHPFAIQTIEALANEAARPFEFLTDVVIHVRAHPLENSDTKQPVITRRAEVLHALTNFIENAVGFARTRVDVSIGWSAERIQVVIADDGPGFDPTVQKKLGEPYVTTRQRGEGDEDDAHVNATGDTGLGLGVFIAKTLLERTGARVQFINAPQGGASVRIVWRRDPLGATT